MPLKKQILLFFSLLFFSLFTSARPLSEKENSSLADSLSIHRFVPNHILLSDSVVNFGKIFLNTPYHYGSPGISSFDCSGFTSHVYRNFGYSLSRSSVDQAKQFDTIDRTQLKAGDLVFFSGRHKSKKVGHVGIVVNAKENGEFDFIHAAVHCGVTISNSNEVYYTKRFIKASRVIGANQLLAVTKFISKSEKPNKEILSFSPIAVSSIKTKRVIPAEYHQVKSGETLSSISKKYGMSVAELKRKNNIKGNKLSLKESLKVKDEESEMIVQAVQSSEINQTSLADNSNKKMTEASKESQNIASNQTNTSHSVKKGETLFSISKIYNISIDELKSINKILKERIHPGQQLKISQPEVPSKNESIAKVEETSLPSLHKVISGESLFSISKANNVPVEELMRINNLSTSKIHSGQELKLKKENEIASKYLVAEKKEKHQELNISNDEKILTHRIKKGENLGSIAKNNNTTVEELKRINNLADSKIHEGQEIKINQFIESKKENIVSAKTNKKQDVKIEASVNTITYKIKKGESLESIAKANNITVDELMSFNNLSNSKIKSGQELKLSKSLGMRNHNSSKGESESKSIQHKVKSGESFYTIAKIYGCSIDDIKDWNRKTGNKIKAGDKIIIFQKNYKTDLSSLE